MIWQLDRTVIALALLGVGCPSFAGMVFTSDFSSPTLHAGLQDADTAFSIAGGNISLTTLNGSSNRHYVRTVSTDYFASLYDFTYEVTFTTAGDEIQFIGIGTGAVGPGGEPGAGSLNFRIHGPSLASGRVDLGFREANNSLTNIQGIGNLNAGPGTHRARISSLGNVLTFQIDKYYTGTFAADITQVLDLSLPAHATKLAALNTESRVFFGVGQNSGQTFVDYDDFSIFAVPEPSSILSCVVGSFGVVVLRRRRFNQSQNQDAIDS